MSRKRKVETITKVVSNQECQNSRQALSQMKRIKWDFQPKTRNQQHFWDGIDSNTITFCVGPAGCGKTYVSTYWALQNLVDKNSNYDGIIVTKPMVEVDGERIGYLPGDIDEKTEPFMQSVYYNMEQIIGKQRLNILKESNTIQVIPMAYMRGITLSNKFVILDEAQNATPEQIKMFVTRIGENSKYIITGDLEQSDIKKGTSGLEDAIKRFAGIHGVGLASFKEKDVVRHSLVRRLLKRYHDGFNIIDDISAEKTISMWIHENGLDAPEDGSKDDYHYKLKK